MNIYLLHIYNTFLPFISLCCTPSSHHIPDSKPSAVTKLFSIVHWWRDKIDRIHSFNWINQQDAATSHVYCLSFKYSSTCFGHPHAHHQELQLQYQPLVYRRSLVIAVLLVVVRPAGRPARPRPTALLSSSSDGKPEAATAVVVALDDGHKDARNMLSFI